MTTTGYLIWFVATAFLTVGILAVGTLAAAGHFPRDRRAKAPAPARNAAEVARATSERPEEARRAA